MADITMCSGIACPVKERCYRFTATTSEFRQSYFFQPPFEVKDGVVTCEMYWGGNAESIWNKLKDITDDK